MPFNRFLRARNLGWSTWWRLSSISFWEFCCCEDLLLLLLAWFSVNNILQAWSMFLLLLLPVYSCKRQSAMKKKICWLLGVTGMTNLISRLWIDNVRILRKCTLGNVCSMQILSTTQTSNNSNFIQFLEMLSTHVSFVHRLLFYYHVYWRLQSARFYN